MWEGAARGATGARGNGGGLLCVVLGDWAVVRFARGRGWTSGSRALRGPGKEDGMGILFLPGVLPRAFSILPGFRRPGAAAREAAFPEWKVL